MKIREFTFFNNLYYNNFNYLQKEKRYIKPKILNSMKKQYFYKY